MGNPSQDYVEMICSLYGSSYDDRIENTAPPTAGTTSRIPGDDWTPGTPANHKSLISFQRELAEQGIKLSTSKIKKILVTGGLWTTQQTRAIQELFSNYTASIDEGGQGMTEADAIRLIAKELEISVVSVSVSLPYSTVVYNLPEPSSNAMRCRRWKVRQATSQQQASEDGADDAEDKKRTTVETLQRCRGEGGETWKAALWRCVVAFEGHTFQTSGRESRPGISFSYMISRTADQKGGERRYSGENVDGYGNELWVTTSSGTADAQKLKKSISRSTVELGYRRAVEMHGVVKGPKSLNITGSASYLWAMLREFGMIKGEV